MTPSFVRKSEPFASSSVTAPSFEPSIATRSSTWISLKPASLVPQPPELTAAESRSTTGSIRSALMLDFYREGEERSTAGPPSWRVISSRANEGRRPSRARASRTARAVSIDPRLRQARRLAEARMPEVEELEHRIRVRVARRQRGQVEARRDEAQDRRVIVGLVRHEAPARIGRHDHDRHADAVAIEGARLVAGLEHGRDGVGHAGGGWGHVVEEAAVLVVGEEEGRAAPLRAREEGLHD